MDAGAPRHSAWDARLAGLCRERRAAAAGWQVALAAAKFARLWILDWTLVSYGMHVGLRVSSAGRRGGGAGTGAGAGAFWAD